MNTNQKYILICILLILFLLYVINISKNKSKNIINKGKNKITNKNIKNKSKNNIYGGNTLTNCTLNDISRHNTVSDKWVYLNGIIYDLSRLNENTYPDNIIKLYDDNLAKKNIITTINIIRYTDLQDLYIIFKSITAYNSFINSNRDAIKFKYDNDKKLSKSTGDFILIPFENSSTNNNIEDTFIAYIDGFHNLFVDDKLGVICPLRLNI